MKKVIVVGAGIAGMAAGIYALQSGFEVTLLEQHNIPGGFCTSWNRRGYLFEGGLHWLTGSAEDQPIHRLWHEVGALSKSSRIHCRDPFLVCDYNGLKISLPSDLDRLKACLCSISPEDAPAILRLCRDAKSLCELKMPVTDIAGLRKIKEEKSSITLRSFFRMLPAILRVNALGKLSVGEYKRQFKHPAIRMALSQIAGDGYAAIAVAYSISSFISGDGGYVEGGSLKMASDMANRFLELGGYIRYGVHVENVVIKEGRVAGVIANGEHIGTDAVIVASDTLCAIDRLFEKPICEPWAEVMRKSVKPVQCTFISIGVEADLSEMPEAMAFSLENPISFAGKQSSALTFYNYANFAGYAPTGCTAMTTVLEGNYEYWKAAREDGSYMKKKQDIAEQIIARMEEKFPQTKGKTAVWDVATPLTYERYCGSYEGSWMTMLQAGQKQINFPCKPKTIGGLYFAGHRLIPPGGLPIALTTGRRAVQYLCRDNDTVFRSREG